MPETKKAAAPEAVEAPASPVNAPVDVKGAILDVIRNRVESLSKAHTAEVNIATRYDYRVRVEELVSIYNEIANLQL